MADWDTLREQAPDETWRDVIDRFKAAGIPPAPDAIAFAAQAMTGSPPDDEPPPTA